eukprot:jgi/Mesvir1/5139/Mv15285-RA.1
MARYAAEKAAGEAAGEPTGDADSHETGSGASRASSFTERLMEVGNIIVRTLSGRLMRSGIDHHKYGSDEEGSEAQEEDFGDDGGFDDAFASDSLLDQVVVRDGVEYYAFAYDEKHHRHVLLREDGWTSWSYDFSEHPIALVDEVSDARREEWAAILDKWRAASGGHDEVHDFLRHEWTKDDCDNYETVETMHMLRYAVRDQVPASVSRILTNERGADANARMDADCDNGPTLLHAAVRNEDAQTVKILLHFGADVLARDETSSGNTPLHEAAAGGATQCLQVLLDAPGCDVNVKNGAGATPLAAALHNKQDACAKLLRARGGQ